MSGRKSVTCRVIRWDFETESVSQPEMRELNVIPSEGANIRFEDDPTMYAVVAVLIEEHSESDVTIFVEKSSSMVDEKGQFIPKSWHRRLNPLQIGAF